MTLEEYLRDILGRETVLLGILAPVERAYANLMPAISCWANGNAVLVTPSGSFAKGTANCSGTDLDLFLSIPADVSTPMAEAYRLLAVQLRNHGYTTKLQNVSIGMTLGNLSIDLVPGRLQNPFSADHTVFHRRTSSWRKTNIARHIEIVRGSGRQDVIRLLKLWRNQNGLEFPSFYLELVTIRALQGADFALADNVRIVLQYLADTFVTARFVDPANTANILSDDLTVAQKLRVRAQAKRALEGSWTSFVN